MGNGASVKKTRYIGGKTLPTYFNEVIWSENQDLFENLGCDEVSGLSIFVAFAMMDQDQKGKIDSEKCISLIGSSSPKFTKRLFFIEEEEGSLFAKNSLTFTEFFTLIWAYCSLSAEGVARYCFEIFDIDNRWVLEKNDLKTMFRMLYMTEEHDESYIKNYPFSGEEQHIHKDDFIEYSTRMLVRKKLIQPAIDYQIKMRKKVGGNPLWDVLIKYRRKKFHHYDWRADTLQIAARNIVASDDPYKKRAKLSADKVLEENKKKVELENKLLADELANRENDIAEEQRLKAINAEDNIMKVALAQFIKYRKQLQEIEFNLDSYWDRHDCKQKLYELLDVYLKEHAAYWENKAQHKQ